MMLIINYLFICFIFGTTFLAIKAGIEAGVDPFLSAGLRFFLAGLVIVIYFTIRKKLSISLFFSKHLLIIGFCLTTMTFMTLYWAEQYITSGLAAVLSAFGPIIMFLLQAGKSKEKIQAIQIIGLLLSIAGVIFISSPGLKQEVTIYWFIATIAVIAGQLFYSIGTVMSKSFLKENEHASPFLINGIQMTIGGSFLLIFSVIFEQPSLKSLGLINVQLSLLYLIIVGSIIGHGLFYWLVSKTNPVFPSTWLYVSPVIAVLLGAIVLKENITVVTALGAVSVLVGVFFINKRILEEMWRKNRIKAS